MRRKQEEREEELKKRRKSRVKDVNVTEAKEKERVLKLYAIKMAESGTDDVKSNQAKGKLIPDLSILWHEWDNSLPISAYYVFS